MPYEALRILVKLTRSVSFYAMHYIKLHQVIARLDLDEVVKFKFLDWHNGYSYFSGYKNGQKVFIKIDLFLHFLGNDYLSYQIFQNKINVLPVIDFIEEPEFQVLIFPFVDGKTLTENDIIQEPKFLEDVHQILIELNYQGIIHRDIRLENFMVINNSLFIIDFTFSCSLSTLDERYKFKTLDLNNSTHKRVLRKLGARLNPSDYVWNDFYSVSQVLGKMIQNSKLSPDVENIIQHHKAIYDESSKDLNTTFKLLNESTN